MPSLIPYRPWNFRDRDANQISRLMNPERNKDDRSPFVQYARSAAMWAEWVREATVVLDPELQTPMVEVEGNSFRYGLLSLDTISPLVSVPPAAKDHHQRLLEATQLYSEPIVVIPAGDDRFTVVGNHELFAAAKFYQAELIRPGKQRSSDVCLVAVCSEQYFAKVQVRHLNFASARSVGDIRSDLIATGYADSPRTDDPTAVTILLGGETFSKPLESGNHWTQHLAAILGLRGLDFGSNDPLLAIKAGQTKVTIVSPPISQSVLNIGSEFPYGSYEANISPLRGANMWSLRDFRAE